MNYMSFTIFLVGCVSRRLKICGSELQLGWPRGAERRGLGTGFNMISAEMGLTHGFHEKIDRDNKMMGSRDQRFIISRQEMAFECNVFGTRGFEPQWMEWCS
jgi:hypothetical protein